MDSINFRGALDYKQHKCNLISTKISLRMAKYYITEIQFLPWAVPTQLEINRDAGACDCYEQMIKSYPCTILSKSEEKWILVHIYQSKQNEIKVKQ